MKNVSIFALSSLLLSVAAVPMKAKRDIVWVTETAEVVETVLVTTTIWVNAGETAYARGRGGRTRTSTSTVETTSLSTSTVYVAPSTSTPIAPTSTEAPSSTYVAPTTAEAPSSTYVPPPPPSTTEAPSSTYVPPPAPTSEAPSSTYVAPSPTAAPIGSYSGELTWYETGLGSCGVSSGSTEPVVAISHLLMDSKATGNPNNNPFCGRKVSIEYGGKTHTATVVDRCTGCKEGDLDLSKGFFDLVTGYGDGRVGGAKWGFVS